MGRPIVLSNGELHVGINARGLVHDFYYPYVGLENHAAGQGLHHRIGVWVEGQISWLDEHASMWEFRFSYPHEALIGQTIAINSTIGIRLEFQDVVDVDQNAFLRNIQVINLRDTTREVRIFMHQAFAIGDSRSHTDTAQYLPDSEAIVHYRGRRVFAIGGRSHDEPFDQYSIGLFGSDTHQGTFKDAEDGELSMSNVEHGRVDSTMRFRLQISPHDSQRIEYWISAGKSLREALHIDRQVRKTTLANRLHVAQTWWQDWLGPAFKVANRFDQETRSSFIQSMLLIKSHIDVRGAVIASTDSTMLNYSRDAYAYCWPRDGAYVLWPLIRLGYREEPERFFEFCRKVMHPMGYLSHKYRADGALGSSWHPYIHDGSVGVPIQEDETALVVFIFSQYFHAHPSKDLLDTYYESMVQPMALFLADYVDTSTHLPKPSYDLWEEKHLTSTYTTAVVYAALLAAAELADAAGDADNAVAWRSVADDMYTAAHKHLYNKSKKVFYKGFTVKHGVKHFDETIDTSSIFGAFMFGLFPAGSIELQESMKTLLATFSITRQAPGLPRYEYDTYHREDPSSLGNPWINCTLWLAQYYAERERPEDVAIILEWVHERMSSTGILPEQVTPGAYKPISVAPLIWSHAEYVATLLDTITDTKDS